jgi:hypothetical protein
MIECVQNLGKNRLVRLKLCASTHHDLKILGLHILVNHRATAQLAQGKEIG